MSRASRQGVIALVRPQLGLQAAQGRRSLRIVENQRLAPPKRAARWTRIDDYVVAMARLRAARRQGAELPRTQPETPRWSLSTLPFVMLMAVLAMLAVAIAVDAWPGRDRSQRPMAEAQPTGIAPAGWFERAKREMR
jgi:hypothetical protein